MWWPCRQSSRRSKGSAPQAVEQTASVYSTASTRCMAISGCPLATVPPPGRRGKRSLELQPPGLAGLVVAEVVVDPGLLQRKAGGRIDPPRGQQHGVGPEHDLLVAGP